MRIMLKEPAFTLGAVLSLAVGIGANTTIFSAINGLLFRSLPYRDSHRIVAVLNQNHKDGSTHGVSTGDLANWRKQNDVFDQMEAISTFASKNVWVQAGGAERVGIQYVTSGLFQLLGINPSLGRLLTPEDALPTNANNVVVSYAYWHRRLASDPQIIGKSFFLDTTTVTVVGVLPLGFDLLGTGDVDIYQPIATEGEAATEMTDRWLMAVCELKSGVTVEQARSSMNVVAQRLEQEYPATNKGLGVKLMLLRDALFGRIGQVLYPALGAVGVVLLIACVNIANLMLSRASSRHKEVSIRLAVGATRLRLIRQMLTESMVLALLGGALGVMLSVWGTRAFVSMAPVWYPRAKPISIDGRVMAFTLAISVLTGIVFGLAPALRASKPNLLESLKEGGRSSSGGERHRNRSTFVVLEIALALVLLVSATLMLNTYLRVLRASPGFSSDRVLTVEFRLTGTRYLDISGFDKTGFAVVTPEVDLACRKLLERIMALPGVESAALIDWLPMSERMDSASRNFTIVDQPASVEGEKPSTLFSAISPDYFRVMQIPLLRGHLPSEQDTSSSPWVAVVNEAMARKFWPHQDPIGRLIAFETVPGEEKPRQIIGIIGNVKQFASRIDPSPEVYVPYLQQPQKSPSMFTETRLHKNLVVRTNFESIALLDRVRKSVADMDRNSPVFGAAPLRSVVWNSTINERFYTQLLGSFATVALLLAGIGIYGVVSHSVAERNREIGLRLALGARPTQVVQLILGEALRLAVIGVTIGLAGSFAITPIMAAFLYGVRPHDPFTLSMASVLLVGFTLLAAYVPSCRAAKVDPLMALRYE
jgi:putative ABC transport system permease protein